MHRRTLLIALSLAALPASAQTGLKLDGGYVLDTARGDEPLAAINRAVSSLGTAQRAIARSQLRGAALPPPTLKIALTGDQVTLTLGTQPPLVALTNGTPVTWARGNGWTVQARASMAAGALTLTLTDGERIATHVYRPADARSLTVDSRIENPLVSVPVTYRTYYVRQ